MDQDFNLWQKLFQSKPVMRATGGLRYLLGNEQEKKQLSDLWGEDVDNSLPAIMGLTRPFRMGSNILGQYYGSALTGQDMTQQENQGRFLQWLSSALTPEEQTQIEERPYLNALKSSAGMASTLMPFAKAGVVSNVGSKMANPTLSKFTNLLSRGGLEGGVGGFGYSREGKELQDTLLGMGLGAGGEVLGGLISDPTFRRGMGQEIKRANSGNYEAMLKMGDDGVDDIVYDLGFDGNSETIDMYPASNMREDRFKPVGQIHFSVDEGAGIGTIDDIYVDSMYQRKGLATNALKKLKAEYPDIEFTTTLQTDDGSALFNSPEVRKILGTDTGIKPPANIGSLADDADNVIDLTEDKLYLEAKKYDTPEEFISSVVDPLYEYNQKDLNIFKDPDIGKGTVKDAISDMGGIKNVERGFIDISQIEPGENININAERAQRALQEIKGGLRVPIIAEPLENGKFLIQDGNNRYIAYKSLGIKEIPIIAPKGSGLKQPKTEDLLNLWEQAHSTVEDLTKPMEERLLDSRTIGEAVRDDTMKLRNIGKDGQTIFKVTRDNSPKSTRPVSKPKYSDLIKAAKKEARSSKIPIRSSEEDLLEEMRKTAERWGLYR